MRLLAETIDNKFIVVLSEKEYRAMESALGKKHDGRNSAKSREYHVAQMRNFIRGSIGLSALDSKITNHLIKHVNHGKTGVGVVIKAIKKGDRAFLETVDGIGRHYSGKIVEEYRRTRGRAHFHRNREHYSRGVYR